MSEYLTIVPGTLKTRFLHRYLLGAIGPRPIAFASTISADGSPNLSPFSFFNIFSSNPPTVIFSPARRVRDNTTKDTLSNVRAVPEVVVNVVSHSIVQQMNLASSEYPTGVNEIHKAGFTPLPSDLIRPLRIAESPVQMECRVTEIKPLGNHGGAGQLIFGEILRVHINKEVLNADGNIDPHLIDLVGRMGDNYYCRASGDSVFEVEKPLAIPGMGIDALPESIRNSSVLSGNDLGRLGNMPSLPKPDEVREWWQLHGGAYSGKNLHEAAKALLADDRKEDALFLLLKP